MALQGLDYRPGKTQEKIFDKGDIKELFKSSIERNQITSVRESWKRNGSPFEE